MKFYEMNQMLTVVIVLLFSVQCYAQNFVCDRLPNESEISTPIAQLESRRTNMPAIFITFNRPEHFTCLAVRGLNRYSHVAVAVNYTTQLSSMNYIVQFIMECNENGNWAPLVGDNVIRNVPGEVFDLPTNTSCSTCFIFIPTINRRRRQMSLDNGCMNCPSRCSSIGAGHCVNPPQSIDCCPFFEQNGTCTTNCSSPNFVPNNQTFVCECPLSCSIGHSPNAECSTCVPTHVCLTDNPCQNGATCRINSQNNSDYTCMCVNEYSGLNCEVCDVVCGAGEILVKNCTCAIINICTRDMPCENGQTCVLGTNPTEFICLSSVVEQIPMLAIVAMVILSVLLILCALGLLIEVIISNYRISRLKKKIIDPVTMEEVIEMRDAGQMDMDDNSYEDTVAVPSKTSTTAVATTQQISMENNDEQERYHESGNVTVSSQWDNQSPQREPEVDGLQEDVCDQVYDQPFMNNTEPSTGAVPPPQVILSRAKTSSLPSNINSQKPVRHTYVNLTVADEELHARSCQQLERARSQTEPDYYLTLLDENALQPSSTNSLPISRSCTFVSTMTSDGTTSSNNRLTADTSARPASIVLSQNPSYESNQQFRHSFRESSKPKTAPKPLHLKAKKPFHTTAVNRGAKKYFSTKPTFKASKSVSPSISQTLGKPTAYSIDTNVSTAKFPSYENLEVESTIQHDSGVTDEDEIELTRNPSYESSEVLDFHRPVVVAKSNGYPTANKLDDTYEAYV